MKSSRASSWARSTLSVVLALTALGACSSSSSSSSATPDAGGDDTADTGTGPVVDAGPHADASPAHDASGADAADSSSSHDSGPAASGNESWVWVYTDYANTLATIGANKTSFTHVSPTFYTVNYAYASGVAYYSGCPTNGATCTGNSSNAFDGMTTQQFTAQATAYGLVTVPLIFGGSENDGVDTGVQNILDDTNGAQAAFISAMTTEAVTNGYGGYNLDWEVGGSIDGSYASKFVTFVNAFKAALAPHGMSLSADAIVSNINGTYCSSNNGYLDFGLLATSSIDRVIIEDYIDMLGTATTTCQDAKLNSSTPIDCDFTLTGELNFMCPQNLPAGMAVIGLEADPGSTNPIAGTAFSTIESYGFTRVAVWPQAPFMNTSGIQPNGSSWYTLLHDFLTH